MRRSIHHRNIGKKRRAEHTFAAISIRRPKRFKSVFERDLAAMRAVWKMLKRGTVRALGEIGRQYH